MSAPSSTTTFVLAALLAAGAVVAFYMATKSATASTQSSSAAATGEAAADKAAAVEKIDEPEANVLAKSLLIDIFVQITASMEKVIMKISQLEQQLVNQAAQENQPVDYDQLRVLMMNEFKNAMKDTEARIYAAHKVTEAQVEASAKFFADDADFQQALKTLKRKFALFTGQAGEDVPDHVTKDLVISVMSETMQRMTAAMEEVFNATREVHQVGSDAFNQTLQARYVERVGVIRSKVQKKYSLDQVRFVRLRHAKHSSAPLWLAV